MASSSFSIDVNPAVLRWARSTSGQGTSEAASKAAVSEKTLVDWEAGRASPTWTSLKRLARCYQRPVASLLLPEPPASAEIPTDFRKRTRSRTTLSAPTLLAIRTARWLQSRAIEMRQDLGFKEGFSSRKIAASSDHRRVAEAERARLGIDLSQQLGWQTVNQAFREWKQAISDFGVLIFQFQFPREELQGFSLYDKLCPVIVVNESEVFEARIFTLFHEYAHLLLREPGMCLPSEVPRPWELSIEPFCNRFASALLVPDQEISRWPTTLGDTPEDEDDTIKRLANRYRVSNDVILIKLKTASRISDSTFVRIYTRWSKARSEFVKAPQRTSTKQHKGSSKLQICLRRRGDSFINLVIESLKRGAITDHDALNYLDLKIRDLDRLERR